MQPSHQLSETMDCEMSTSTPRIAATKRRLPQNVAISPISKEGDPQTAEPDLKKQKTEDCRKSRLHSEDFVRGVLADTSGIQEELRFSYLRDALDCPVCPLGNDGSLYSRYLRHLLTLARQVFPDL